MQKQPQGTIDIGYSPCEVMGADLTVLSIACDILVECLAVCTDTPASPVQLRINISCHRVLDLTISLAYDFICNPYLQCDEIAPPSPILTLYISSARVYRARTYTLLDPLGVAGYPLA